MDCSEEAQSLSDEASTPMELKKGMSIFLDVSNFYFISQQMIKFK